MSELSAAAAAALGIPEAIVQRSAAARAEETGTTVDEVLAAWAGGGDIPAPTTAPAAEEEATAEEAASALPAASETSAEPPAEQAETPPQSGPPSAPPAGPPPSEGVPVAPTAGSGQPPVLVGEGDNPIGVLVGALALFVMVFLVGLVGPALPTENPGARSSELAYSETALRGRHIYQSVGCSSCHTQMVRPIVADVDLGAVTLNDSNQVLGTLRFGPDLSNVGARVSASQIEAVINGLGGHPSVSLSPEDLNDLVTYLLQSRTLEEAPAEGAPAQGAPGEEEPGDGAPAEGAPGEEESAEEEPTDT